MHHLPGEPAARTTADIARLYADRHRQVPADILLGADFVRLRSESVILLLQVLYGCNGSYSCTCLVVALQQGDWRIYPQFYRTFILIGWLHTKSFQRPYF